MRLPPAPPGASSFKLGKGGSQTSGLYLPECPFVRVDWEWGSTCSLALFRRVIYLFIKLAYFRKRINEQISPGPSKSPDGVDRYRLRGTLYEFWLIIRTHLLRRECKTLRDKQNAIEGPSAEQSRRTLGKPVGRATFRYLC